MIALVDVETWAALQAGIALTMLALCAILMRIAYLYGRAREKLDHEMSCTDKEQGVKPPQH